MLSGVIPAKESGSSSSPSRLFEPDHLERERLLVRLDRLAALVVIHALPGHGKTVLAAHWARRRAFDGETVIWIDADETLDRTERLFARLHAELLAVGIGSGDPLPGTDLRDHLVRVLRDRAGSRVIVVIDRFDRVDDPQTIVDLARWHAAVPGLHLVVCTRSVHALELEAKNLGLSTDHVCMRDLRAGVDETIAIAASWGRELDRTAAADIVDVTDGWLLLIKLMLESTTPSLAKEAAIDFLRRVVFPSMTDRCAVDGAMRLALAPLVTPAHVRAVAARFDSSSAKAASEDVRIRLSHQGLLVASSKGEGVWRIPQAVREALVSEYLSGSPGEALLWHRVFAKELQETRDSAYLGLIVGHARAAEDWCYLLELWEENSLVLIDAYPADFVAAYGRMPSSVLMEHRGLAGAAAAADAIVEHPQGVATQRALLQVFREAIRPATGDDPVEGELELKPEPEPEADGAGNRRLLLLAVGVIADRVDGRVAQALAGAARLYRELTERPRAGETQPVRRAWVVHQWAQTLLLAGDEGRALEFELRAFSLAQGADTRTVAAHVASNIALIHAMEGNVDAARNWIGMRRERDTTGQWNDYIVRLPADIAEALLALDRLDRPEVERAIARMQDPTGQPEFWPFVIHVMTQHALLWADPMVALSAIDRYTVLNPQVVGSDGIATRLITRGRADLLLALGEVNKVKRLIDDAGSETPWLQTVRARLHLVCGNHQRALHIASAGAWDSGTATRDRIDQLMIVAAASYARGNEAAAVQSFAMASSLADELGAIRPFALIAPAVREALLLSSGVDADHTRLDTVRGVGAVFPRDADLVTLSERELAVLYEMTRSQRLTEIARELVVSSSTVKKQMVSLYSKLGVHDRDAAMLRATRLGLLPVPMKSATDQV